jgi:hypothetical protein
MKCKEYEFSLQKGTFTKGKISMSMISDAQLPVDRGAP